MTSFATTARAALCALLCLAAVGCVSHAAQANVAPRDSVAKEAAIEFAPWKGTSFGSYLAPKAGFADEDGGVHVVFHFHAPQMAGKDWQASGVNAVVIGCQFGMGTSAYSDAFADPTRFSRMIHEVLADLSRNSMKPLYAKRVSLVAWSAGFAAVSRILSVPKFYEMVDTVVLLDGIHSNYLDPNPRTSGQGASRVDVRGLSTLTKFAGDAKRGTKAMVITHSSIATPDYANTTEATEALLKQIDISATRHQAAIPGYLDMSETERADAGNLHMRGYTGKGKHDHINHLHLVKDVMIDFCVPRWRELDKLAKKNRS